MVLFTLGGCWERNCCSRAAPGVVGRGEQTEKVKGLTGGPGQRLLGELQFNTAPVC